MTVTITFNATTTDDLIAQVAQFLGGIGRTDTIASVMDTDAEEIKAEKKPRKPKEEKVAEPKAEVFAPEKPKYTLQDAIDRAREIVGDGKDEKIMTALKAINTRLGISKVREIPPEKLEGYMKELGVEFPKEATGETKTNMFD